MTDVPSANALQPDQDSQLAALRALWDSTFWKARVRVLMARLDEETARGADLRRALDAKSKLIDRQADHIAMLEQQLAANGPRAQARLRRSSWFAWRKLRARLAGSPL